MKYARNGVVVGLCLAMMLAVSSGCKKKPQPIDPGLASGPTTLPPESPGGAGLPGDIDQDSLVFGPSGLQPIYFDYDSYALRPDALETLRHNADVLKQAPNAYVQIEGHCDERGTQEYNLALGEKRALATREHLVRLGISGDRMITISYGEEDPVDPGHSESAWSKNRRAEFNKANR